MYVDRVKITNLRCFAEAEVAFVHPDREKKAALPNVTLLLGNNGAGKTTVLRAVALGALNVALRQSGYVPYSMIRRTPIDPPSAADTEAILVVHSQDVTGIITHQDFHPIRVRTGSGLARKGSVEFLSFASPWPDLENQIYSDASPGVLVLGYGATRRVDPASEFSPGRRRKERVLRYSRVASLFEDQVALVPLAGWLPKLTTDKPRLYARVHELLDQLIPPDTRFTGELDGDEYLFERAHIKVGFAALSDGYRGYIGLLGDLFYHLCNGLSDDDDPMESRGIVLIDEIDQHLHPAWQRVVIPTLAKALPNLQFILSTHSPIIAGTVYAENIRLLESNEDGTSRVEQLDEEIHGLNADQVLLTEAFGLTSSRAPDFVKQYEQATRDLDPNNWKDALQLMRMINRGSAGTASTEPEPEREPKRGKQPAYAEDRPAVEPRRSKKPASKKPASKKRR